MDSKEFWTAVSTGNHEKAKRLFAKADANFQDAVSRKTALHIACENSDEKVVTLLLIASSIDVDLPDKDGNSPIHIAARNGSTSILESLLKRNAQQNVKNNLGQKPLALACKGGHLEACISLAKNASEVERKSLILRAVIFDQSNLIEPLINFGIDVDTRLKSGNRAIHLAAQGGKENCLRILLRYSDKNDKNSIEMTPLALSCSTDKYDCAKILIHAGADVNCQRFDGNTPMHRAAFYGYRKIVELLIQAGADLDMKNNDGLNAQEVALNKNHSSVANVIDQGSSVAYAYEGGKTDLHIAAERGDMSQIDKLLLRYPIEGKTFIGETPLILASFNGHLEIVSRLLQAKADPNNTRNDGYTALSRAAGKGYFRVISELIKTGAKPWLANGYGETPLMAAVNSNHIHATIELLKHDCGPKHKNHNGLTALHIAAQEGSTRCLKQLLPVSDINLNNTSGDSALMLACASGQEECLSLLLYAGADTSLANEDGHTALSLACDSKHLPCALLLGTGGRINLKEALDYIHATYTDFKEIARLIGDYKGDPEKLNGALPDGCIPAAFPDLTDSMTVDEVAVTSSHMYCPFKVAKAFIESLNIDQSLFDSRYDVCFCGSCHIKRSDNLFYSRGIPFKTYGLPIGWCKFGLRVPPRAETVRCFKEWHVAFHGTHVNNIGKILESGELLMSGDVTPQGNTLAIPLNHWDPENPGMQPPKGHDVTRVYLSPSIKYSGCDAYSTPQKWKPNDTEEYFKARVAFQVRIKPDSYDVGPQTIGAKTQIDPMFPNSELEWSTNRRCVAILVGLLVKLDDTMDTPRRSRYDNVTLKVSSFPQEETKTKIKGTSIKMTNDYVYTHHDNWSVELKTGQVYGIRKDTQNGYWIEIPKKKSLLSSLLGTKQKVLVPVSHCEPI